MKYTNTKFFIMFLAGILFSAITVFAATISVNTNFGSNAIQYLQNLVLTDATGNTGISLDGVTSKISVNNLCNSGGDSCVLVDNIITGVDLSDYLTGDALDGYLTGSDLDGYLTGYALDDYLTGDALDGYLTGSSLDDYLTGTDLVGYLTGDAIIEKLTLSHNNHTNCSSGSAGQIRYEEKWCNGSDGLYYNTLSICTLTTGASDYAWRDIFNIELGDPSNECDAFSS